MPPLSGRFRSVFRRITPFSPKPCRRFYIICGHPVVKSHSSLNAHKLMPKLYGYQGISKNLTQYNVKYAVRLECKEPHSRFSENPFNNYTTLREKKQGLIFLGFYSENRKKHDNIKFDSDRRPNANAETALGRLVFRFIKLPLM